MKTSGSWLWLIGLPLGVLCLLGFVTAAVLFFFFPSLYGSYLENSSLAIGSPAPDFELPALTGGRVRLSQFRGQPVLLCLSTTWCPGCRTEAPVLQKLHEAHPELIILMVDSEESPDVVRQFANEFGITHPILLDEEGAVMKLYRVVAIPTDLFIDAQGLLRAKVIGSITPEQLEEKLPLIGVDF